MGRKRRGGGNRSPMRSKRASGLVGVVRVREHGGEVETAEGTLRLSERGLREAMDGDRVYVSVGRGRGGARRATVEQVIERATTSLVGTFEQAGPLGALRPLDRRVRHDFFVLPEDDSPARAGVRPGDVAVGRIVSYPTRVEAGVVTLERRVGSADAPSLGIECIMARYGLTDDYAPAALDEAAAVSLDVEDALADPLRRDVRDRFVLTIDPVDARDFDDAISVARTPSGGWELGVHIADVSHYVPWGSSIDMEARRRSTSVYLADRVLPMLPERLCNDVCSLRPDEDRLAFTVDIELDARARVRGYRAYPSVIRSRVRTDYGVVDALLAGGLGAASGADAAAHAASEPCAPRVGSEARLRAQDAVERARASNVDLAAFLHDAHELACARRALRRRRGAIDFDTVEVHALLDADGMPCDIVARERTDATSLVEEAMLLANECVAEYLADRGCVTAYRVHGSPSPDSLAGAVKTLAGLGLIDRDDAGALLAGEPHAIARAVEAAAHTPSAPLVNALLLRAQQRAVYRPHNERHYALGASAYCHFTSPIRRYPDLLVHRALKLALARERLGARAAAERAAHLTGTGPEAAERICPQLCRAASEAERTADAAAHASQKVKVAQFYGRRVGERFAGSVSWVSDMGAFVRLDETGAEGLVRIRTLGALTGSWWDFDETRLRLTSSATGDEIVLGQRAVVEVAGVDVLRGHVDFKWVHPVPALH